MNNLAQKEKDATRNFIYKEAIKIIDTKAEYVEKLFVLKEQLADAQTSLDREKGNVFLAICDEKDEHGKAKFSNEKAREMELLRRTNNGAFTGLVRDEQILRKAVWDQDNAIKRMSEQISLAKAYLRGNDD